MLVSTPQATAVHSAASVSSNFNECSDVCVVAEGDVGLALACLLFHNGHDINVLTSRAPETMPKEYEIRLRRAAVSSFRGTADFARASNDAEATVRQSSALIIGAGVTEYGAIAERLAPFLKNGQTICLVNAVLGAGLQFAARLKALGSDVQLNIIEMGTLFDCARIEDQVLLIIGQREKVSICGSSRNETRRGLSAANALSRGLVPASNLIERGLSDVERILRPALLLMGIIGGRKESLDNISSLLNPSLLSIASGLDSEVQQLAKEYKCVVPSFSQALRDFALCPLTREQCSAQGLEEVLLHLGQSMLEQAHSDKLSLLSARQLMRRDILETLSVLSDMARLSRIKVRIIDSIIELASVVLDADLSKQGRTLQDLGLIGYDVDEIVEQVNA